MAIANDRRGVVQRSVESLADLPDDLPRAALVGGLAVMVRLYEAHRVTTDFDEVTDDRDATIAVLLARGAVRTANGVMLPDHGVQLDLLDAGITLAELGAMVREVEAAGITEDERRGLQLAMVNRYGLETAVATDIHVVEQEAVVASVSLPVAAAGALVAMKANAATDRTRKPDKAASDIFDVYRLIRAWGPSTIAEDLSRAPVPLLVLAAEQLCSIFVDDVERTVRRLRAASVPGVEAVDADDLEAAGAVVESLAPFIHWD